MHTIVISKLNIFDLSPFYLENKRRKQVNYYIRVVNLSSMWTMLKCQMFITPMLLEISFGVFFQSNFKSWSGVSDNYMYSQNYNDDMGIIMIDRFQSG